MLCFHRDREAAHEVIKHLDTPERLIELSSFLYYYHFELDRYPVLKGVLEAQGLTRPPAARVIFGCDKFRTGKGP